MGLTNKNIEKFYKKAFDLRSEKINYLQNDGEQHIEIGEIRAVITSYRPDEILGTIQQPDRKVFILKKEYDDLLTQDYPKKGDRIFLRGRQAAIMSVDDSTRSNKGEIIAFILQIRG